MNQYVFFFLIVVTLVIVALVGFYFFRIGQSIDKELERRQ